jgi:hypothetical protein
MSAAVGDIILWGKMPVMVYRPLNRFLAVVFFRLAFSFFFFNVTFQCRCLNQHGMQAGLRTSMLCTSIHAEEIYE